MKNTTQGIFVICVFVFYFMAICAVLLGNLRIMFGTQNCKLGLQMKSQRFL